MDKKLFENNPNITEYFETSDGSKFYTENLAKNHARDLKDKAIKTVERPEEKVEKISAADIIELAPEMDIDEATEYLENENGLDKPRKTVVEALTSRIEELEK